MILFFLAGLTTIARYRYDVVLANQTRQSPEEETQYAQNPHPRYPLRGDARHRSRPAFPRLGPRQRPAWQAGIPGVVEGHRILHRCRSIQAWDGILSGGAQAEDRADPQRRLQ